MLPLSNSINYRVVRVIDSEDSAADDDDGRDAS